MPEENVCAILILFLIFKRDISAQGALPEIIGKSK